VEKGATATAARNLRGVGVHRGGAGDALFFAVIIPDALWAWGVGGRNEDVSRLILGRYTRGGLWSLFLMCALPQHAWTLIMAFRDLDWLTERTNAWDAIGVLSYGLLFALVESALLFLVALLLGLIVPRGWEPERRTTLLGSLVLVLSFWAIVSQWFFVAEVQLPEGLVGWLAANPHPLWVIYAVMLAATLASFLLPAWAVVRQGRGLRWLGGVMERLGLLATLYLVFDVAAVAIVVIRNL
jgi:hypothetical protein